MPQKRIPTVVRFVLAMSLALMPTLALAQRVDTKPDVGIQNHPIEDYLIIGATIVTSPGQVIEGGQIWIADGKIVAVGTNLQVPAGLRTLDLKGKTIYPGFVDAGIEVDLPEWDATKGTPHWNSEIVAQRSVTDDGAAPPVLSKLRKAGITAALIAPSSGIIKGSSSVLLADDGPLTETILKDNVALHVRLSVTRGRGRDGYPSSPMGAVALARQTFHDALWYEQAWRAYRASTNLPKPETNSALEAIQKHVQAGKPVVFDALNEQYALRADSFAREFGLKAILRGTGQEYQLLDPIARTGRTIILPLNFPKPPNVATFEAAIESELEELMHWELAPENPGRLAKAGVPFVLTSQGLSDASELVPQIRKAIARGLDPTTALAAITTAPAALLNVEEQVGTIASGRWANLVVTSGSLWDEKTKIEEVWVRGKRPVSAYKNGSNIDGQWDLQAVSTLAAPGSTKAWPNNLVLTIKDSDKRLSASLANPLAAEVAPVAEAKSPSDVVEPPKAPDAVAPAGEGDKEKEKEAKSDTPADDKAEAKKDKDSPKDNGLKLNGARWGDQTLSGTFNTKPIDKENAGVAQLSLAYLANANADGIWQGSILWPDGTQQSIRAVRKPEPPKTEAEKSDATGNKSEGSNERPGRGEKREDRASKPPAAILSTLRYPFGSYGREALPEQPELFVIQNTTLWTSGPQGILREADMIVRRGKIEAIGVDLPVPAGATVIDGSRYQISPGLIDCHSHMATDSGVNEGTQAVTAEVRIGDFINAEDITIYRQLAGGLTSSNILHGSANPIGGQNQVIKLRWGGTYHDLKFKDAPAGIKFALGENVKQSNSTDASRSRYPTSRMGVEQIFRDRFNAAREYDRAWKAWNAAPNGIPPRKDLELDAIAEILRGERWIHCHSYRQDEILALLRVTEEYGIRIGSLQHILEGYKVADAIAKHGATASSFSDWWAYKLEVYDAIPHNGAIMHDQGIVVSFNSDDAELGRHMNHEAAKAVKYGGVDPAEALKFVTLNPAKQLRIDSHVGSLEVGKDADFAVWSGSPLAVTSRCEQTWIDGRKYFDRASDAETRVKDTKLKQALIQKVLDSGETAGERSSLSEDPSRLWPNYDEYCHHHHDEDGDSHDGHDQVHTETDSMEGGEHE
ncbi:MAG: amidohydrolase family protein [Planctomycetota bacterium]